MPCVHFATALLTRRCAMRGEHTLSIVLHILSGALVQTHKRSSVNFIKGNTNENSCTRRAQVLCCCCCERARNSMPATPLFTPKNVLLLLQLGYNTLTHVCREICSFRHRSCRGGQCSFSVNDAWRFFATRNSRNLILTFLYLILFRARQSGISPTISLMVSCINLCNHHHPANHSSFKIENQIYEPRKTIFSNYFTELSRLYLFTFLC